MLPIVYRYYLKESANFTDTDIPHTDTDNDSWRLLHTGADTDTGFRDYIKISFA